MTYQPTYTIVDDGKAIRCAKCGMVSHNPSDVKQRYCAKCDVFHDDSTYVTQEKNQCPCCGKKLDATTGKDGRAPVPHDVSLCAYCAELLEFDDNLRVIRITHETAAALDDENWTVIKNLQRLIAQRKKRH